MDEVSHENEVEVEVEDDKKMDVEELNVTLDKLTVTELRLQPEELKQTESDEKMETLQVEGDDEEPKVEEAAASVEKNSPSKLLSEAEEAPQEMGEQIAISDNKENNMVSEGMKPAGAKESINLNELSMIKLTKMLKEKLQITNKSSKHGNEATARPALQQLP